MANTQIKLLRAITQQHPTAYNWVTGNNGTITNGEPWVNVANKQLWVDNKCINPELTLGSVAGQYFSLNHDLTSAYNATTTLEFDFDALKEALDIPTITHEKLSFTDIAGTNQLDYDTTVAKTITFGQGLVFNNGMLSCNLPDGFLDSVDLVNEDGDGNSGTFLKFTWNTAAADQGKTDIYIDVADFYDDTDTKTQLEGVASNPIEVSLVTNSGVWTTDALNTYSVIHKAITVSEDTTPGTTAPGYGGTFQIIKSVGYDNWGHITSLTTETIKMPDATDIPEYQASKLSGNISNDHKTATWLLDNGVNGTVNVAHAAQDSNGVGSMVEFTTINQDTANSVYDITMQITVIDGGTC